MSLTRSPLWSSAAHRWPAGAAPSGHDHRGADHVGVANGLRILSVAQEWQTVVTGIIIIAAVYADMLRRRRAG
jgi:hypothetical protein